MEISVEVHPVSTLSFSLLSLPGKRRGRRGRRGSIGGNGENENGPLDFPSV